MLVFVMAFVEDNDTVFGLLVLLVVVAGLVVVLVVVAVVAVVVAVVVLGDVDLVVVVVVENVDESTHEKTIFLPCR